MSSGLVVIDLQAEGLRHAPGHADGCGGMHTLKAEAEDLDVHDECWWPPAPEEWKPQLQKLHEAAHPKGTVFVDHCREETCETLMEVFGS